ncbi:MAG: translation initiation factor IF-2 [Chitinophagaceae bacterium]|nr:translation initiation factor IF-2 [Chitinophagaceae bacterium]
MAETTTPRLMAAAKEFNVGKDTLVDFLLARGFSKDDLKPTSKLTEEMYRSLQQEFQSDKVAKLKSDQIDLPKGSPETKKRKEDETVVFRKETKKSAETPKGTIDTIEPKEETLPAVETKETKKQGSETIEEIPALPVQDTPAAGEKEDKEPAKPQDSAHIKIEPPEIEAPVILDKIDLSAIDSSTRPKKIVKKKEEKAKETPVETTSKSKSGAKPAEIAPAVEAQETIPKEKTEMPAVVEQPVAETPAQPQEEIKESQEEAGPVISNIKAEKIEGPKILGKIELPVQGDNKTNPNDEKRQRKRIPIARKDVPVQRNEPFKKREGDRPQITPNTGGNFRPRPQGTGHGRPAGARPSFISREAKEIDKKEIQDKIRETQAKLAGSGGRGKSLKAKYRRAKRDEMTDQSGGEEMQDNKLQLTEFISVSELANLMDVSYAEVIGKCMGLGLMVSINQRLDAEVIELVASEFGYDVEFIDMETQLEMEEQEEEDDQESLTPRAPIVTIMGHVDHGKTSLLDYIRSANVVAGEAGGITQHIGAYEVTLPSGKHITFLDTPGHEAFTAMRARGAKVTDIAVIVIAADDAVMPQTKEAISHAQAANVPMIFAINKIDKDGANPQKIYEQLAGMNILVEAWGGKFQSQELSAKQGLNVDQLLEKVLLEAELLDLKANPNREASGTIVEATLDKGRGYVATVLVLNGTLRHGDLVVSGQYFGRVKAMFNERNKRKDEAPPATPVLILGLNGAPQAGEKFKVYADEAEAKDVANRRAQILREQGIRTKKHITLDEIGRRLALGNFKQLNLIIKGDVDGSVEALSDSLQKLSTEEIAISVVLKGVGAITESDVLLATASDAILIGFNVRPSAQAARLADTEGVEIKTYSIIYNVIDEVKSAMEGMLEPKIQEKVVANVEVRNVFKFDKASVAGCYVLEGKIYRNSKVRVIRDGIVIYPAGEGGSAELGSLKRFKDDVKEVSSGMECGLTVKNFSDIKVGDIIEAFEEEEVKRTL